MSSCAGKTVASSLLFGCYLLLLITISIRLVGCNFHSINFKRNNLFIMLVCGLDIIVEHLIDREYSCTDNVTANLLTIHQVECPTF